MRMLSLRLPSIPFPRIPRSGLAAPWLHATTTRQWRSTRDSNPSCGKWVMGTHLVGAPMQFHTRLIRLSDQFVGRVIRPPAALPAPLAARVSTTYPSTTPAPHRSLSMNDNNHSINPAFVKMPISLTASDHNHFASTVRSKASGRSSTVGS
jgi:hypothetical protein